MINIKENERLNKLNHSCAHLLAQAVKHLYPHAMFWVGPVIDDGFYYDIDLGDEAIKEEKNPSEKLYETVIANFISRRWPQPYSVDEFWRYGLDSQGDMLNYMMSSLHKKNEKPKRRGWIGSSWNFGSNHGDYVKSLRILQYIIDSGIYVSLPGTYMLDVANWYIDLTKFKGLLEKYVEDITEKENSSLLCFY